MAKSMFRSEAMALCQLFLQSESVYACVSELGELGLAEFRDLNPDVTAFQRKFVNEVRRCDEMERKLRFLHSEIERSEMDIPECKESQEAPHPREMIDLEAQFEQIENEMKESNANYENLLRSYLELTEVKHILQKTQSLMSEETEVETHALTSVTEGQLRFVSGVITRDKIKHFEQIMWRACFGKVYFKYADIPELLTDPISGEKMYKCVFHVFYQGEQLEVKVKKICEAFRATIYPCPDTPAERREMSIGVLTRLEDLQSVINQTQEHRNRLLQNILVNIPIWDIKVKKIKAIYHTMNMFNFDVTQKCLIAECWVPIDDMDSVRSALRRGTEATGTSVPSILNRVATQTTPPTFNRTNIFTCGFQAIVDAYGVADYEEVNPSLYTIITFPFLFSVMFGDLGHGTIMALFALLLILKEKQLDNVKFGGQMFGMIFQGRYIVFLMGVFSMYAGLMYNDMLSKSLNIFGSGWVAMAHNTTNPNYDMNHLQNLPADAPTIMLDPRDAARVTPYYFGLDPVWQIATNKLTFTNSLKMKLSIIFGVIHMIFGVILSVFNHLHFKQHINIWCEFIPQLLFMGCIFGYLVILIFYKWVVFSINDPYQPSLLLGLIGMFLHFFSDTIEKDLLVYSGQKAVQTILVVVAVISVPWMLLVKPMILLYRHRQETRDGYNFARFSNTGNVNPSDEPQAAEAADAIEEEGEVTFRFGEIFIHQAIHTIEYCLGCISNTASYLRLWALSLAHAQLSEVLWSMVFRNAFVLSNVAGYLITFFIFSAWAALTIAILLIMEGLSAFLHTLRLHWVEFNSKFYNGQGHAFRPFSLQDLQRNSEQ